MDAKETVWNCAIVGLGFFQEEGAARDRPSNQPKGSKGSGALDEDDARKFFEGFAELNHMKDLVFVPQLASSYVEKRREEDRQTLVGRFGPKKADEYIAIADECLPWMFRVVRSKFK